jgi:hypothetical protein
MNLVENVDNNTLVLYHGGRGLEYSYNELRPNKKGTWEHGPGLYLTDRLRTARDYAKGGGRVYKVTVELGTNIDDVSISLPEAVDFVKRYCVKTKQAEIIRDLDYNLQIVGKLRAEVLVNLIINYEAIQLPKTIILRKFLIEHGVDYEIVKNYGGDGENVYVVINPRIIKSVEILK